MSNDDTTRIIARNSSLNEDSQETVPFGINPLRSTKTDDDSHTKIFRPSSSQGAEKNDLRTGISNKQVMSLSSSAIHSVIF